MENKFKLGPRVLAVAVLTLITSLTWIFFEIYQSARKSTIPQATQEEMKILNPSIDKEAINALKKDLSFSQEELNTITPVTPIPTISQPATQSGILEEGR